MADVSVNGWIAEGGHTIVEGKKNNIILFEICRDLKNVSLPASFWDIIG